MGQWCSSFRSKETSEGQHQGGRWPGDNDNKSPARSQAWQVKGNNTERTEWGRGMDEEGMDWKKERGLQLKQNPHPAAGTSRMQQALVNTNQS